LRDLLSPGADIGKQTREPERAKSAREQQTQALEKGGIGHRIARTQHLRIRQYLPL